MDSNHADESQEHTCYTCGRSFDSELALQKHRNRMHEGWIGRIREALPI